ncbi:MAG TPA: serine hydrolase domain-containing protein [Bryobacteraceae bacterium]|nr:serine hydrolase domain-containing protein [Bryobacteraceae bacterium]
MSSLLRILALLALSFPLAAQLPPETTAKIDAAAEKALADSGAPSVSIAVVKDGRIAYVKAYGKARLDPVTAAAPEMRYSIGSVSKQFMAAAILMLAEEGKLSLDDKVGRYLPNLTRANEITIRRLLTHTSGYQDYYPLDYVAPFMQKPVTADEILERWAGKALDFDPGTRWQYSNTNFVAAGRILEKVSGQSLWSFLEARIFRPLGMTSAIDLDARALAAPDAAGYTHFGLGPARPAEPEARGWLFAAGELAMTARDLAKWDISLIDRTLLKPASLDAMTTPVRLKDGAPTNYALGIGVVDDNGYPRLSHGGAVSGFVSRNTVWPDARVAVVAFANMDGSSAPGLVTNQIAPLLLSETEDPQAGQQLAQARRVFSQLQEGKIDRTLLSGDAEAYFTAQVLRDAAASLGPLGKPEKFEQTAFGLRGGMTYRNFQIGFKDRTLHATTFTTPDGKLAQYLIQ